MSTPLENVSALPLVGRGAETELLTELLTTAFAGRGSTLFLTGDGGVGKTRLVFAALEEAKRRGFLTAIGRAFPVEAGVPYALFADALLPTIRAMTPETRAVLTRGVEPDLSYLFPSLRDSASASMPAAGPDGASEFRSRLLWNFTRFLKELANRDPMLVVLEDLHWADASSLELLHFIARQMANDRLVMLCTHTRGLSDTNRTLRATEQSLASIGVASTHTVAPLSRPDVDELVRRVFDIDDDAMHREFTALLFGWTRGNPFFVTETLKALIAGGQLRQRRGVWVGFETAEMDLPQSVVDVLSLRLAQLSNEASGVAEIAAVVGTRITFELLRELSGLDDTTLATRLDELIRHEMLADAGGDRLAYDFTHPILRHTMYSGLGRTRAALLHATVAAGLERYYGDGVAEHAGELAYHFARAEGETASRAAGYLAAAGADALAKYANREAADYLAAALERIGDDDDSSAATEVLRNLARARQRLGDYDGAMRLWWQLHERAERADDHRAVAQAHYRIGLAHFWSGHQREAIEDYEAGLHAIDAADLELRVQLHLARGICLCDLGRAEEAKRELEALLSEVERSGSTEMLARLHRGLLQLYGWSGPSDLAREHGARALELAERTGDLNLAYSAHWAIAETEGLRGNAEGLKRHLAEAERIAETLRSPVLRLWTNELAINFAYGSGELRTALALGEQSIAMSRDLNQWALLPRLLVWTALVHLDQNEIEIGKRYVDEAWTLSRAGRVDDARGANIHAVIPAHIGRAAYYHAVGDYESAIRVGEAGLAIVDRTGYTVWAIHRLVPLIAEACLWLGDLPRARRYGERLRRDSKQLEHALGLAWAEACDALVAWLHGDSVAGAKALRDAANRLERIPFIPDAVRLRRQLAGRLAETGDREGALAELRRVHDTLVRLGAERELDKARIMFRELGSRPPARSSGEGIANITPREIEIARLVASRKSNKAIGRALGISPRTVSTHLSNLFKKLDISTRGELVDRVRRGELAGG